MAQKRSDPFYYKNKGYEIDKKVYPWVARKYTEYHYCSKEGYHYIDKICIKKTPVHTFMEQTLLNELDEIHAHAREFENILQNARDQSNKWDIV